MMFSVTFFSKKWHSPFVVFVNMCTFAGEKLKSDASQLLHNAGAGRGIDAVRFPRLPVVNKKPLSLLSLAEVASFFIKSKR